MRKYRGLKDVGHISFGTSEHLREIGIPVTIAPLGFVEPLQPGQQTCPCTAVHFPCPFNLYR